MKNHKIENTGLSALKQSSEDSTSRVPYARPQILSAEELEAAAASCSPVNDPYGKTFDPGPPIVCATLGS